MEGAEEERKGYVGTVYQEDADNGSPSQLLFNAGPSEFIITAPSAITS